MVKNTYQATLQYRDAEGESYDETVESKYNLVHWFNNMDSYTAEQTDQMWSEVYSLCPHYERIDFEDGGMTAIY